jgi:predicted neutral ceramidase superfamily lipid hydrolase
MSVSDPVSRSEMSSIVTAIECGSSSRTPSSAASRMISAMRSSSDSSVTTPSS